MTSSEKRHFQRMFIQEFGCSLYNLPLFKWERTSNMHYMFADPDNLLESPILLPSGVYACKTKYERHCWAEHMGDVWCIAHWVRPSMTEAEWVGQHGTQFAFQGKGYYRPVEGTQLTPGREPTIELTELAIECIREQIGKSLAEFTLELKAKQAMAAAERERVIGDMVDDAMPAFLGVPGAKDDVSFPSIAKPTTQRI